MGPLVKKRRRKRGNNEAEANVPPKVLRRDHEAFYPAQSTHGGKSLASMRLDMGSILSTPATQDPSTAMKSVSDLESLSYAKPQPHPEQDIAQSSKGTATEIPTENVATMEVNVHVSVGSPESGRSTSVLSAVRSPGDFLSKYNINLARQVAMGSQLRLKFEQEVRLLKKARAVESEVHSLQNQTKNLKTLLEAEVDMKKVAEAKDAELAKELDSLRVMGEEKIKAAFEEFKKYEDDKVEQRCVEMDAPITGRRWVIGYGMRLAIMKCAKSLEIRQTFADVVSIRLAKEANSKLVKALQDLKDLKYPMVDQLERLKDASMELIMTSLHLESDTREDAPQWIHDIRLSSSQLKILVYPKKCKVVCRTDRIGSTHHARSDGILVSAPTVVPQGLAILLADAATQTEAAGKEEEPHLRL
ncbi:hypothetical protein Tco_0388802 [Tanacetum coccineum]